MKAAIVTGERTFTIRDVPDPVPVDDEVVIEVKCCGICGSDLHLFKKGVPIGAGHEFSGDIVEVGKSAKGWKVGDRVTVEPRIACNECFWCREDRIGLCDAFYSTLLEYSGAFATYAKTRCGQLHNIPDDMSYEHAALVEPTACSLHAVRMAGIENGDVVAILGLGSIGQIVARLLKHSGAGAVYASEISSSRMELAREFVDEVIDAGTVNPADRIMELTSGEGANVVYECAGSISSTQDSIAAARKGGTVVIAGICFDWAELPLSTIVLRELIVKGAVIYKREEYPAALDIIRNKEIDLDSMLTGKMGLEDINEAFERASRGEGGKVLIIPSERRP